MWSLFENGARRLSAPSPQPGSASRLLILAAALFFASPGFGYDAPPSPAPSFWDPSRRLEKPDMSSLKQLRFVTEDDYPPFNFALQSGEIVGFNVDLARAICEELEISCTIQRRRWDLLISALNDDSADAAIASLARTPENRAHADFTAPYYVTPGRFVTLAESVLTDATPEALDDRSIAVIAGSAHEAYLKAYFPKAHVMSFETSALAKRALKGGRVHALFGDAISLSLWLNGAEAGGCCVFKGGPYVDERLFGDGVGIAVKKGGTPLRRALDYALARLAQRGAYAEIYLKYFPVSPF
ncbi:MAG TPA: transporter substrate-binding domain-containing protein [Methylocystis sp.]|nr:transporter substrate-binding domain-containing protein [Methylocystis sp.]